MLLVSTLLLTALFVACATENALRRYEAECRTELENSYYCQRACELEKMGLMSDGKVDIGKMATMVDENELRLYPDNVKNLLKVAFRVCHKEIDPDRTTDKCSAASAVYYCVTSLLQPEKLYREEVRR